MVARTERLSVTPLAIASRMRVARRRCVATPQASGVIGNAMRRGPKRAAFVLVRALAPRAPEAVREFEEQE